MSKIFKFLILGLALGLFTFEKAVSQNNCIILHKGTFKYADMPEEIIVKIKGVRHIEYYSKGKYKIDSRINWVSDCEYNMTMTKITLPNFPYSPGDVMNVKIEHTSGDEIYYVSTVKGKSWKGKLIKIKD